MSAAPLAGVRVVTIALNLPGPVAAARFRPSYHCSQASRPAG